MVGLCEFDHDRVWTTAFNAYECSDLITYGPTTSWDTAGFSQATITDVKDIGDDHYNIELHLDNGYFSSYPCSATTGRLDDEYSNPSTSPLQAGPV